MGLFDYLLCDAPLPETHERGDAFQTKSLMCTMDTYRITADRMLMRERPARKDYADVKTRLQPCQYTGELRFYTDREVHGEPVWTEYIAWVVHGEVKEIHKMEEIDA